MRNQNIQSSSTSRKYGRLSPCLIRAMKACREDLSRMMQDDDLCESCPLLDHCVKQQEDFKKNLDRTCF